MLRFLKPQVLPLVKPQLLVRLLQLLVQLTPSLSRLHQRLLRKLRLPATQHQLPNRPLPQQVALLPLEIQLPQRVRPQAMPPRLPATQHQRLQRLMKRQVQLLKQRQLRWVQRQRPQLVTKLVKMPQMLLVTQPVHQVMPQAPKQQRQMLMTP